MAISDLFCVEGPSRSRYPSSWTRLELRPSLLSSLSLSFGRGMKGPTRGHVNDTTALMWEETVIIYTIMTTARRPNYKTVTIKITTTNRETQVGCNLPNKLYSNCRKIRFTKQRRKQLQVCSLSIRKNETTSVHVSLTTGGTEGLPRQRPLCQHPSHPSTPPFVAIRHHQAPGGLHVGAPLCQPYHRRHRSHPPSTIGLLSTHTSSLLFVFLQLQFLQAYVNPSYRSSPLFLRLQHVLQ